jgi:hypothetical protein
VHQLGNQWKDIARALNEQYQEVSRARTAENVKDKYKQLGAENAQDRLVGEWSLQETLALIKSVEAATQIQILYPLIKISFKIKDTKNLEGKIEIPDVRFKV